jgi:hypothetical protein
MHSNDSIYFITYDHEHHRIALSNLPNTAAKIIDSAGLNHTAFPFDTLFSLLFA